VQEKQIPIFFKARKVGIYIPDIVVDDKIFLEIKCKSLISQEDKSQFWYYLKVTNFQLGFLVNFGTENGVEIIRRVYNNDSASVPCS